MTMATSNVTPTGNDFHLYLPTPGEWKIHAPPRRDLTCVYAQTQFRFPI